MTKPEHELPATFSCADLSSNQSIGGHYHLISHIRPSVVRLRSCSEYSESTEMIFIHSLISFQIYTIKDACNNDSSYGLYSPFLPLPFSLPHLPCKGIAIVQHLLRNLNTIWHLWLNVRNTSKKRLNNLLLALLACLTDGLHLHLSLLAGLLLGLLVAAGVLDGVSTSLYHALFPPPLRRYS